MTFAMTTRLLLALAATASAAVGSAHEQPPAANDDAEGDASKTFFKRPEPYTHFGFEQLHPLSPQQTATTAGNSLRHVGEIDYNSGEESRDTRQKFYLRYETEQHPHVHLLSLETDVRVVHVECRDTEYTTTANNGTLARK